MTKMVPSFNAEVNLGHILIVGSLLVSVALAWGDLRAEMRAKDVNHETRIASLEDQAKTARMEQAQFQQQVTLKLDKVLEAVARLQAREYGR